MNRAREAIALSMIAVEADMHSANLKFSNDSRRFYEIVGYDIIFDENVSAGSPLLRPHATPAIYNLFRVDIILTTKHMVGNVVLLCSSTSGCTCRDCVRSSCLISSR